MRPKEKTDYDYVKINSLFKTGKTSTEIRDMLYPKCSPDSIRQANRMYENSLIAAKIEDAHPFAKRVLYLASLGKTDASITDYVAKEYRLGNLGVIGFKTHVMAIKVIADRVRPDDFKILEDKLFKNWFVSNMLVNLVRKHAEAGLTVQEISGELMIGTSSVYHMAKRHGIEIKKAEFKQPVTTFSTEPHKSFMSIFFKQKECYELLLTAFKNRGFTIHAP